VPVESRGDPPCCPIAGNRGELRLLSTYIARRAALDDPADDSTPRGPDAIRKGL
jgi:hypothetical protein